MPVPNGPSFFADVYAVTYNSVAIYAVSNIQFNRKKTILKGKDNNKLRPVATHNVEIEDSVTFDFEDINAIPALETSAGAHDLVFTWKAASQTLTTSPLATQTVTIKNVVIENIDANALTKGWGKGKASGTVLEVSDDSDPIVFAAAS